MKSHEVTPQPCRAYRADHCGNAVEAGSGEHGLYLQQSLRAQIIDNYIYANQDRGIQIYFESDYARIANNVVDRNGANLHIGGRLYEPNTYSTNRYSDHTLIENNIFSNATLFTRNSPRFNIETFWASDAAQNSGTISEDVTQNVLTGNCVYQPPSATEPADRTILPVSWGRSGLKVINNFVGTDAAHDPQFRNQPAGDYRLQPTSPCLGKGVLPGVEITGAAQSVTATTATVVGAVNPHWTDATYHFEFQTDDPATLTRTLETSAGSGTLYRSVSAALTGLRPATTYYYRLVATGSSGSRTTERSPQYSFTTADVPCAYALSSTAQTFTASAQSGSVNVQTTAGCGWTAQSNAAWLTITAGTTGAGNGTVAFNVAANNTNAARTGTLHIAGQTFTVTQQPPAAQNTTVQFDGAGYSPVEFDGLAFLTVTRSGNTSGTATVEYVTNDDERLFNCNPATEGQPSGAIRGVATSRCDYTTAYGTLQFAPNETFKQIAVNITNDAHAEGAETFSVSLRNPTGAALGATTTAVVTIQDEDAPGASNPVADKRFFIRQHYLDFFGRNPMPGEIDGWVNAIKPDCGVGYEAPPNPECYDRLWVSGKGFFESVEFYEKGYYAYRFYKLLGRSSLPRYRDFVPDMVSIANTSDATKNSFAQKFAARADYQTIYGNMSNDAFIDELARRTGLTTLDWQTMKTELMFGAKQRPQILRQVVESREMQARERNEAYVVIHYFAYLRRDPAPGEIGIWRTKLDQNPNEWRALSYGFVNATEHRNRFGQP